MRLSLKERDAITLAVKFYLADSNYRLLLFGSRTDDRKKGGDIDLLLIVPPDKKNEVIELKKQNSRENIRENPRAKNRLNCRDERRITERRVS